MPVVSTSRKSQRENSRSPVAIGMVVDSVIRAQVAGELGQHGLLDEHRQQRL